MRLEWLGQRYTLRRPERPFSEDEETGLTPLDEFSPHATRRVLIHTRGRCRDSMHERNGNVRPSGKQVF